MFLFLIWYILLTIVVVKADFTWWMNLLIIASWVPTGLWCWYYSRSIHYISNRWKYVSVFRNRKEMMSDILTQRKEIIEEFETIAKDLRAKGIVPKEQNPIS